MFSHLQDQVMIFKWSPLFSIVSKIDSTLVHQNSGNYEHVVLTQKQTIHALTEWLVPIVASIVPYTLVHMHSIIECAQGPCFLELQGNCSTVANSSFVPSFFMTDNGNYRPMSKTVRLV